ncbi:M48 family metallopeptidase [Candidatus Woesebacteria bacterium]|nr:M48 family metallopeptidase [Candidatus Woesebacteria bacterium]
MAYVFGQANGSGLSFAGVALIISGLISLGSYYFSDSIVLSLSGARLADAKKDFDFFTVAENLSIATGLPRPKLYVIDDSAPNAFATGRDPQHAVVCATTGILEKLDRAELEGVIAHELSHIKNYDIRLMGIISVLVGTVALLADMFMRSLWYRGDRDRERSSGIFVIIGIILALISPLIATIIQLAVSRRREYLADASGALITRNPSALARALEKISKDREVLEAASNATAHLYIVNPFKGKDFGAWFAGLFNTHPPIEERIKILRSM